MLTLSGLLTSLPILSSFLSFSSIFFSYYRFIFISFLFNCCSFNLSFTLKTLVGKLRSKTKSHNTQSVYFFLWNTLGVVWLSVDYFQHVRNCFTITDLHWWSTYSLLTQIYLIVKVICVVSFKHRLGTKSIEQFSLFSSAWHVQDDIFICTYTFRVWYLKSFIRLTSPKSNSQLGPQMVFQCYHTVNRIFAKRLQHTWDKSCTNHRSFTSNLKSFGSFARQTRTVLMFDLNDIQEQKKLKLLLSIQKKKKAR